MTLFNKIKPESPRHLREVISAAPSTGAAQRPSVYEAARRSIMPDSLTFADVIEFSDGKSSNFPEKPGFRDRRAISDTDIHRPGVEFLLRVDSSPFPG